MKPFFLLLTMLGLLSNAYSASFVRVSAMGDERLSRLAEIHQELDHLYNNCSARGLLQIEARRLNEKWENTVRQAVYYTNTGVNAPVRGVSAGLLDLRTDEGLDSFVAHALSLDLADTELSYTDEDLIQSFRSILGTLRGDFMFYVGGHANLVNSTQFAVIVDLNNAELLVFQPNRCL